MRILTALVVWVAAVVAAVALSSVVSHSIPKTTANAGANGVSGSGGGGGSGADPSSIASTDKVSLFRTANLERALGQARTALGAGARVSDFVIYPGYLSITAAKNGRGIDFYVDANGRVVQTDGGSADTSSLFPLAKISATVPAALAHRIATAAHVPESQLHYVVVDRDSDTGNLEWLVYGTESSPVEYFKAPGVKGQLLELKRNSSSGLRPVSG